MATTPSGTVLTHTFDIVNSLITSGTPIDANVANVLGDMISNIGERLLEIKNKEVGVIPAEAPAARAVPTPTPAEPPVIEQAKALKPTATAPASTTAPVTETSAEVQGNAIAETPAKRKPGRPKGSGKKAAEAQTSKPETVAQVLTGEVIPSEENLPTEAVASSDASATQEKITEFNNPDPKAPDYKFKSLLERFGTNPDGSAKRFNNLTEEETFDGEVVISLFDGTRRKMLKRHLGTDYGMTVAEYVTHFGLSKGYRPVGKDFAASKSIDAKKTKLGHKPEVVAPEQPIATPVKAARRTRTRAAQDA